MISKILKSLILILMLFLLSGCWDYVGLNGLTIVTGVAVDKDEKTNKYKLSYEIINLSDSSKNKTAVTKIIESTGDTIFDAIRNAKKRVMNKLYFANMQIVVVSKEIAEKDGLGSIIDWFIRDVEVRETINFAVSEEKTAKEILDISCVDSPITSYQIKKIIRGDNSTTSSTMDVVLYKIYNIFKSDSASLALPVFHIIKNAGKETIETNGIATFKKDKLIGWLNAAETKYYLFIDDNVDGGILPLSLDNKDTNNISLEIAENKTSKSYSYKNNKVRVTITTKTKVYLGEYDNQPKPLDDKTIKNIQKKAEEIIEKNIKKIVQKAKDEFKTDIFGFGTIVYEDNPKLWKKIKKNWDSLFENMEIIVKPSVVIANTAYLK